MKSIILGINNEYGLFGFDDGFSVMVRPFAFWMELLADFVLDGKRSLNKNYKKAAISIFISQFFLNVGRKCAPTTLSPETH